MSLEVSILPVLSDNYIFIVRNEKSNLTAVVDPAESTPVVELLEKRGWTLDHIWITHHHNDHIGGVGDLKNYFTHAVAYAPKYDHHRIKADHYLSEGDRVEFGHHFATVLFLPGHTSGHIAYHWAADHILFCGDVLFSMGCGRLFEGTAEQMFNSLARISVMPSQTRIYCTHEYSQKNSQFALTMEPKNEALRKRIEEIDRLRKMSQPTIPTTLAQELQTNPFLRSESQEIRNTLEMSNATDLQVFTELRRRRNHF